MNLQQVPKTLYKGEMGKNPNGAWGHGYLVQSPNLPLPSVLKKSLLQPMKQKLAAVTECLAMETKGILKLDQK